MDVGVDPDTNTGHVEPVTTGVDTNGNDQDVSEENDNIIEDSINEAASEDSGMSSVDNHNMSGSVTHISRSSQLCCQHNVK